MKIKNSSKKCLRNCLSVAYCAHIALSFIPQAIRIDFPADSRISSVKKKHTWQMNGVVKKCLCFKNGVMFSLELSMIFDFPEFSYYCLRNFVFIAFTLQCVPGHERSKAVSQSIIKEKELEGNKDIAKQ